MLAAAAAVALARWQPSDDPADSLCLLRRWAHLPCPGCGFTRAVAALARGDLERALALQPLAPLVLAELALLWLAAGLASLRGRRLPWGRFLPWLLAGHGALFVLVWVWRLLSGTLPP